MSLKRKGIYSCLSLDGSSVKLPRTNLYPKFPALFKVGSSCGINISPIASEGIVHERIQRHPLAHGSK